MNKHIGPTNCQTAYVATLRAKLGYVPTHRSPKHRRENVFTTGFDNSSRARCVGFTTGYTCGITACPKHDSTTYAVGVRRHAAVVA